MSEKTYNVLNNIVETVNYIATPFAIAAAGVAAIWGYTIDWSIYTAAFAGMVNGIWAFVKLFIKVK